MDKFIKIFSLASELGGAFSGTKEGALQLGQKLYNILSKENKVDHLIFQSSDKRERSLVGSRLNYYSELLPFLEDIQKNIYVNLDSYSLPLIIGGDHSVSISSCSSILRFWQEKSNECGLIWFDAHGDLNTDETTPSGNIHGMSLAVLLGRGDKKLVEIGGEILREENVILIGVRDLDRGEKEFLKESKINVITTQEVKDKGVSQVLSSLQDTLTNVNKWILSFDLDVLDPALMPSVSTPADNGLSIKDVKDIFNILTQYAELAAIECMEYNIKQDNNSRGQEVAVELLLYLLDKILKGR